MKLRQNAKELVLLELSGVGLLLGEVRYNKQTETVTFALEKSAYFDLYFPCTVSFDPQRGPIVHPHVINAMTTSSIRIQRSRVNYFVLSQDIVPAIKAQYMEILSQIVGLQSEGHGKGHDHGATGHNQPVGGKGGPRVIELIRLRDKKDSGKDDK